MQTTEQVILDFVPIKDGGIYVDIGSGSGHLALALANKLKKNATIYAVDIRNEAVEHLAKEAKQKDLENIFSICADAEKPKGIPLQDESADVVVISHALPFMEDKLGCFMEAKRLLKDGGFLTVIESNIVGALGEAEIKVLCDKSGLVLTDQRDILGGAHTRFLLKKTS